MGTALFRQSAPRCLIPIAFTLFSLLSFPLLAIAQSPQLPQPALLPPTSPLCDSSLVPCLSIDDLAAHGQAQLLILPRTAERSTAITIPYGITMGLFGRISGSVSSSTSFWSQSDQRLQSQGPLRLSMTALLWPLFPLRTDPQTSSFRLGIAYDHELSIGPFSGANSLGIAGDLGVVRVISQKSFGPFELMLSLGALVDPGRRYATGEAAAQVGFHLPFLPSLKLFVEALGRGIPAYVNRKRQLGLGEDLLRLQGALGVGLSYAPHARVDFGVSVLWGTGGISPSVVVFRFAVLSIGKTYAGRAATPLTELGADLAAAGAEKVKEVVDELLKETYEERMKQLPSSFGSIGLYDQLDDAGEVTTGAVIDGAIGLGMGATGKVVGELAEGVEGLRKAGKTAKRARQIEKAEEAARAKGGTYLLKDPETGQVMRTGRTNDHERRRSEHKRHPETKPLDYEPVYKLDDKNTRRGLEQILHDEHQPPLDKIRPISPDNPNRDKYLKAARSYLKNQEKE